MTQVANKKRHTHTNYIYIIYLHNVTGHKTQLLLDLSNGIKIGRRVKRITPEHEKLVQIVRDVTTRDIQTTDQVLGNEAIVHRDYVRDTIACIYHHSSEQTL